MEIRLLSNSSKNFRFFPILSHIFRIPILLNALVFQIFPLLFGIVYPFNLSISSSLQFYFILSAISQRFGLNLLFNSYYRRLYYQRQGKERNQIQDAGLSFRLQFSDFVVRIISDQRGYKQALDVMLMDKKWVKLNRYTKEFQDGAQNFVNLARKNAGNSDRIICPCIKCACYCRQHVDTVYEHLVISGMDPTYDNWVFHGEAPNTSRQDKDVKMTDAYEICMKTLKGYIRNRARPEGCIAECCLAEECFDLRMHMEELQRSFRRRRCDIQELHKMHTETFSQWLAEKKMTMGNSGKDKSKGKRPFLASNTVAREEHEIRRRLDSQSNPQSFSKPSEPTKSEKKKRGPSRMNVVATKKNERLVVEFNEYDQPIGPASIVLSSAMGVFVRETVSILPDCWTTVDSETKEVLWTAVKQKFIIDDHQKENILARMRKLWTDYKSRLSISIREAFQMPDATRKLKLLKPEDVTDEEWKKFVAHRLSKDWKERSEKFQQLRATQTEPHTTSRKGMARTRDEMIKKDPSSGTRVNVWLKSRTRKNGQPINAVAAESMKKLEEISAMSTEEDQTSLKNDGIAKLKGDERPGCVKGMGFGVTPSKVAAQVQGNRKVKKLENDLKELSDRFTEFQNFFMSRRRFSKDHVNIDDNLDNNLAPTPQSFEDSTAIPNTPTNGDICKLLNWLGTGEVVAKGMIAATNPEALVHHVQLGPDYYKVWVDEVNKPSLSLVRPTQEFFNLGDAKGSTIAWPIKYITLD
ncbi:hypothetical protein WN944_005920 [Citrus x changshan-huyou]|uniref:Transposase-associated domain-containing protein n=2 Tax=Citrus TaxID=2706 RepID=A0AAP0MI99_9ROSI